MSQRIDADAVRRLTMTTDPYLSCDDCFDQVDVAVEQLLGNGTPLDEPLRVHLLGCEACQEEAVTLAVLLVADRGGATDDAQARVEAALRD